jgi:Fe-S-cluster containining protein
MECRVGCGACCIAPSISSPIPGMPDGKPAGVRCIQLSEDNLCNIFGSPDRPAVCSQFKAEDLICGNSRDEALKILSDLENSHFNSERG